MELCIAGCLDLASESVLVTENHASLSDIGTRCKSPPGLRLALEEAFSLITNEALAVHDGDRVLSKAESWSTFVEVRPGFPHSYAAYLHFKAAGYSPRVSQARVA